MMGRRIATLTFLIALIISCSHAAAAEVAFVDDGVAKSVHIQGKPWQKGPGYVECGATENYLFGSHAIGEGDFHVEAELTIRNLSKSAATFVLGESNFGFEGGHGRMFVDGPVFAGGEGQFLGSDTVVVQEGKAFRLEVSRKGSDVTVSIDGQPVYRTTFGASPGRVGLRPWRSTMRVQRFVASGNLTELPPEPILAERTQPDGYTIPTIDLSHQKHRQVIVERIPGQYLGHPTTVLMADGKTIYVTYPLGHGGPGAVLKKSTDGGLTWSERLPVPENWATSRNCPCIHRLTDPRGKERLIVFEGNGPMRQAHSEDGGKTWTPFEPNGLHCVVAPITIVPIQGDRLLGMYHRGEGERDRPPLTLWQSISADGGLTWQAETKVAEYPGGNPCEPYVVRSPDGKQLAALSRENARRYNSLLITSDDEGKTWSDPVELPASLTGDRHMGRYAPDGRLVLCFRDTAHASPTKGDFVAWVGTYDDIVNLREGQYRVRLLRSPKKGDLGYPGVEILPDGTFVATTYAVLAPGEKNSVVSVRFHLDEIDGEAARLSGQIDVYARGEDGYHTYRIPSVIVTKKGTVLAFCEGRKDGGGDAGDIDLLLKRSTDGGRTFSRQQTIWDDGGNTCGNPCPVVDRETGTIWLLLTHNLGTDRKSQIIAGQSQGTRTVWVSRSTDDGLTWAQPVEITKDAKRPDWTWYATGPGAGIQLKSGRLLIPCDHIEAETKMYSSHIIYSDDHGRTWQLGGSAPPRTSECEAVELADDSVLLNMRNYNREHTCRAVALSHDGGQTFSRVTYDEALVEPVCQASIRRFSSAAEGDKNRILFSNPAESGMRKELTVRLSRDEAKTWPVAKVLWPGPAAYSSLAVMPDRTILCLYERGVSSTYEKITLARMTLGWLTDTKPAFRHAVIEAAGPKMPRADTASVVELDGGRLMVVYHKYMPGKHGGHDQGKCNIWSKTSADGGRTWDHGRMLVDIAPGDMNVQAPALLKLRSGELLLICLRAHGDGSSSTMCLFRSGDGGRTFVERSTIWKQSKGQLLQGGASCLLQLKSGRLLLPIHGGTGNQWSQKNSAWCYLSDDDGKTWRRSPHQIDLPKRGAMEASVAQMRDGTLVMSLRTQLGGPYIARSTDDGETWSEPKFSGLEGPESCTCLRRIPGTDTLVLFWNNSRFIPKGHHHYGERTPLTAAVSHDGGTTWQTVGHLADGPKHEYTNLDCTFTSTGEAVVTYLFCQPAWTRDAMSLHATIVDRSWFGAK